MTDLATIPLGDLQLFDNHVPALGAGNWRIEVAHTLTDSAGRPINQDALGATQEFVVTAPQFAIDPGEIVSQYPPDSSTGKYAEVLPHIVLKEPLLPWERSTGQAGQPWLALMIFEEGELIGAASSTTRSTATTVAAFLAPDAAILKPVVTKEDDVDGSSSCSFIQIPVAVFQRIVPRSGELRYLAHCRQANISDKAFQELNEQGLFAVVVANRFPAAPAPGAGGSTRNIVHLVSLEGVEKLLVENPDFTGHTSVALISLAAWTFHCQADNLEDFRGLMRQIVGTETDTPDARQPVFHPGNLWLRIPPPVLDASKPAQAEVMRRIADGFVPLAYHTRSGEDTFAWYRGPLAPLLTTAIAKPGPFATVDSALIYHDDNGTFDVSLASAWETGRATALSNKLFGQQLLDFRRRGHRLTDALLHRLQSDHFSVTQIEAVSHDATVQDDFLGILDKQLIEDIASTPLMVPQADHDPGKPDVDPKAAVQAFLADASVQARIVQIVQDDLKPVAQWLGRLLLLYPVPFHALVADVRMLPVESLRFFYVDANWTGALLDGAMSIGMESSRQTFYDALTRDLVNRAAMEAALVYRQGLLGRARTDTHGAEQTVISGFLMRSGIVSGWPNLAVRPYLASGETLKILRMDHLSPNVLLCLFWGVPDYVELSEPQEGFRFGLDDDGFIALRNPLAPKKDGDPLLGQILADAAGFQVKTAYLRSAASRVLNLAPDASDGLVQKLTAALGEAMHVEQPKLGPAGFALQMVKSPEAIKFTSQTGA